MDSDEELQLAIQISLAESNKSKSQSGTKRNAIIIEDDEIRIPSKQMKQTNKEMGKEKPETFFANKIKGVFNEANCISFEELLDLKSGLQSILCSSFSTDFDWLLKQLPESVNVTVVAHWNRDSDSEGHFMMNPRMTIVHPPLMKFGSMHAKFMLLLYEKKIRVVISSSNLTEGDWKSLIQCVWYQDFPKRSTAAHSKSSNNPNTFCKDLQKFLSSLKLGGKFLDSYDFSSANVQLIASVPGYHSKEDIQLYGHKRLQHVLQEHFDTASENVTLEDNIYYQTSSMGALSSSGWLQKEFLPSISSSSNSSSTNNGDLSHIAKKKKTSNNSTVHSSQFHIVFPSFDRVTKKSNMEGSEMIFCWSDHYEKKLIPSDLLFDCVHKQSSKQSILFHSKVLCRIMKSKVTSSLSSTQTKGNSKEEEDHSQNASGWCYIGSHNLSPSAWGKNSKNGSFYISNYELGVLFFDGEKNNNSDKNKELFGNIPFQIPPPKYSDKDQPWMVEKYKKGHHK